ncbi:DUF6508 domain-containing protein [Catenulispora pinisilvae]|uniref:DUF6508 domain-containing protein n=1 Tax=Catenulispora pinisilvae TaxID=2705253 RepID=UPI001890BEAA|nr:DUF6508 domain-containing protein [Catenulispora pinisilvae]
MSISGSAGPEDPADSARAALARLTAEDRTVLADLLRRIDEHDGPFGEWVTGNPDGTLCMPWSRHAPIVTETVAFVIGKQLPVTGFDWRAWEEGQRTIRLPDLKKVRTRTAQECRQYLTLIVRAERFEEGTLTMVFENRVMQTLLRRMIQLIDSLSET